MIDDKLGSQSHLGLLPHPVLSNLTHSNTLLQILALIAMEKPVSGNADDIRDEKVKVIRSIAPVKVEDVVLAQYAAANGKPGYHDDETVPKDSKAPTFATTVLRIHNER